MKKKYEVTSLQAREIRDIIKEYEKASVFRKLQAIIRGGEQGFVYGRAPIHSKY